jgi:hypothetical protein
LKTLRLVEDEDDDTDSATAFQVEDNTVEKEALGTNMADQSHHDRGVAWGQRKNTGDDERKE